MTAKRVAVDVQFAKTAPNAIDSGTKIPSHKPNVVAFVHLFSPSKNSRA